MYLRKKINTFLENRQINPVDGSIMKIVFVSNILPSGHYSEQLCRFLAEKKEIELKIYGPKIAHNLIIPKTKIKKIWNYDWRYYFQIIHELLKDKPDVVHLQHEFNMYGGFTTSLLFPFLLLSLKILNYKVVTTVHAAISMDVVTQQFIFLFRMKKQLFINPLTLRLLFQFIYRLIGLGSNKIICHTNLTKEILATDYGLPRTKIEIIPPLVITSKIKHVPKEKYFFYFGYIVRRKGLEYLIDGFADFLKKYPDYKLIMAGGTITGQEQAKEELIEYIHKKNLKNIIILKGFIENKDLDIYYPAAQAALIPAKISVAASGQLYHAQGYGKCILASDIGHLREEIQHHKNGILVNNQHWAKALEVVVTNKKLVEKMEKGARQAANTKKPKIIAQKHLEVYAREFKSSLKL